MNGTPMSNTAATPGKVTALKDAIQWRYRDTRDSEFANAHHTGYDLEARDCDGDFSTWSIEKGGQIVAMGHAGYEPDPYHFDTAQEQAIEVLGYLLEANRFNEYRAEVRSKRSLDGLGDWTVKGFSIEDGSLSFGPKGRPIIVGFVTNACSAGEMIARSVIQRKDHLDHTDAITQPRLAHLICDAVNVCFSLSPKNPEAVPPLLPEIVKRANELCKACEEDFGVDPTEEDDAKVAYPEDRCAVTFGHMRRLRALLNRLDTGGVE